MQHRFKQTNRKQLYLLPPSIDEWLPQDHLARFIVQITDSLDLRAPLITLDTHNITSFFLGEALT